MKNSQKGIWIGEKDLTRDAQFMKDAMQEVHPSIVSQLSSEDAVENLESNRRDFLKYLGFGVTAATVASCEIPVKRVIPYVSKPQEIIPGVANYYASCYVKGGDFCPILVKTREGRPIKIEGNSLSTISNGGTSARAQAMVLELYDVNRYRGPLAYNTSDEKFAETSWADLDKHVLEACASASSIRIVTNTILSPTAKKALAELTTAYPNAQVVTYDPVSSAAQLEANEMSYGRKAIPDYRFDKADVIVSFNADFLGTWISPVEYAAQFAKRRKIEDPKKASMSRLIQVESHMSLTGSNADNRVLVKPSEQGAAIVYLYNQISGANLPAPSLNDKAQSALQKVAAQLLKAKGKSLVVCGNNNLGEQLLVNEINDVLGNLGNTLDFAHYSMQRQGDEKGMDALIQEMNAGSVDVLIVNNANPAYDFKGGTAFTQGLSKVKTSVALVESITETSVGCKYIAPVHHILESWGDVEAKKGMLNLIQPTISPLFKTRQAELSFLTWAKSTTVDLNQEQPYLAYLKNSWNTGNFGQQSSFATFDGFWENSLHDGVANVGSTEGSVSFTSNAAQAVSHLSKAANGELEIGFFETVTMGNGQFSNNPWLQEMPDPVTRCSWGNYLSVPVKFDGVKKFNGFEKIKDGDIVELTIGDQTYTLPAIQQFGQMPGTVGLALGYGRTSVGFAGQGIGVNVNTSLGENNGYTQYHANNVAVRNTGKKEKEFSCVQYHHTMGVTDIETATGATINADEAALAPGYGNLFQGFQGALTERTVIRNTNLAHLADSVEELIHERAHHEGLNEKTLYPYEKYVEKQYSQGHHWGMHVDLNACIGCGACSIACMAENNVPVVGKKQVSRHQEMTWLRIDRYYYGEADNPNVVYQPMMCQHCDNAPCENVCPVNATNHSSEGLNQMAYNRCVGTRYCANNCPFKVRRFNWLDYTTADIFPANQYPVNHEDVPFGADNLTRMVLNPDVTVRSRGVIEKCSFCVQRLQEGKLTAKKEGRRLVDSDVKSACQTACPTGAITFGDMNGHGELSKKLESPLNYIVLEEINVRPSVQYTMKVTNKDEALNS